VLGAQCEAFDLGDSVRAAWDWHRSIMEAEMAFNLDAEWTRGRDQLSVPLQQQLQRGRELSALDYQQALARIPQLIDGFDELFQRFDAILTPAAPGSAPPLGDSGSPLFCTLWSLCGMPALNLPVLHAPDNLPLGLQLVGRRGDDARLLRSARWLAQKLQAA
jgi:Asp-tRNA(Asn)/Glu-tRNA(Gln) amidotransferase A subunit family amidase